jgi:hypothetical protein
MPGTVAILGVFIALWRRRTEGAPEETPAPTKKKKKKK